MPAGAAFGFLAYALYSCCDAIIKGMGGSLPIYEIAFFSTLFSLLPAIFTKPAGEHWRTFWRLRNPRLVHLRGLSGVLGNLCVIYAFTSIPLAEVYSLTFLAPLFIVVISVSMLGERVTGPRWLFLALSFAGVLLVVRPGFRELEPGHFAAIGAAFFGAVTTTVLRVVAPTETRVSLIGVASTYILGLNLLLMLPVFVVPSLEQMATFAVIGGLGGTGQILFIAATRRIPASQIAPTQYSQIIWAIILGALFYAEFPDLLAYIGLGVVITAGVLNVVSDETRIRVMSRLGVGGIGPATATAAVQRPLPGTVPPEEPKP
jgi:drug/metabolite transporter (DMT)-like permease